jgi:hypothetical protein
MGKKLTSMFSSAGLAQARARTAKSKNAHTRRELKAMSVKTKK